MLTSPLFKSRYKHPVIRENRQEGSSLSAVALASLPSHTEVPADAF